MVGNFLSHLATGYNDLVSINNDDEVTHIHMGSECWLVLSTQKSCSMARETTKDDISAINDVPLARDIGRGRTKGTHSKLAFFDTSLLGPLL